jgi:hypothetical protein
MESGVTPPRLREPAEAGRPTATLRAWRTDRARLEEALRRSDDELRSLCEAIAGRTLPSPPRERIVGGMAGPPGVPEPTDLPRQIALLRVWQAQRERLEEALRHSDDQLLVLCKEGLQARA